MKRLIAIVLVSSLSATSALAIGAKKTAYIGGTIESLNQRKEHSVGELNLSDEKKLVLKLKGQTVEVPYDRITDLEYQNSARRRTTAVTGVVVASLFIFPPFALVALPLALKKKKKHFFTVAYKDADDKGQALVLELGKDVEKEARAVIGARSGKQVKVVVE